MRFKYLSVLVLMLFFSFGEAVSYAQVTSKDDAEKARSGGIERWSFKTNVVDWLVTIPNATVEWDLPDSWCKSDSLTNKMSLSLTARYNWSTPTNFNAHKPYYVFDLLQIRPEFRYYWHPRTGGMAFKKRREYAKQSNGEVSLFDDWYENVVLMKKAQNPKTSRAYYLGAYLDGGLYNVKFGAYGYQGMMYSVGLTTGYGVPVYQYRRGFLDIELGFSVGVSLLTREAYVYNHDLRDYARVSSRCRGLSVAPFPVVSQINVAFVWRKESIRSKYTMGDKETLYLQEMYSKKKAARDARKKGKKGGDQAETAEESFWDMDAYQEAPAEEAAAPEGDAADGKKADKKQKKEKQKKEKPEKEKKPKKDKKKSEEDQ